MNKTGTITGIVHKSSYPSVDKQNNNQPFTMNVYTVDFADLKNTNYFAPKLYFKEGDEVQYQYNQADNKVSKMKKLNSKPYYNNSYNKTQEQAQQNNVTTEERIRHSVAFKGAIDLAASGVIKLDEVEQFTNQYYNFLK